MPNLTIFEVNMEWAEGNPEIDILLEVLTKRPNLELIENIEIAAN
jgi:hypothetical protein